MPMGRRGSRPLREAPVTHCNRTAGFRRHRKFPVRRRGGLLHGGNRMVWWCYRRRIRALGREGCPPAYRRHAVRGRADRRAVGQTRGRWRDAVHGPLHHRGRRRAPDGDPGDHPDAAQAAGRCCLPAHRRDGRQRLLVVPQRSGARRRGAVHRQRFRLRRLRECRFRQPRSAVLQRAQYELDVRRRSRRIAGA